MEKSLKDRIIDVAVANPAAPVEEIARLVGAPAVWIEKLMISNGFKTLLAIKQAA
jgi:hypothetical protein